MVYSCHTLPLCALYVLCASHDLMYFLYVYLLYVCRYEEQIEISSHKYRKEVKDMNYQLQEAESRISDMQDQVRVSSLSLPAL